MLSFSLPSSREPSFLYVCPQCGDAWARVRTGGEGWQPIRLHCPGCPPAWGERWPGSLLTPFIWWEGVFQTQLATALRILPDDWLHWEFEQHLKQFTETEEQQCLTLQP